VRTVTTTSEAGAATAADDAPAFKPGPVASAAETTFVTEPIAPLSTKNDSTPDLAAVSTASETTSAPETAVPASGFPAPTPSAVAAAVEAASAPAPDTPAPGSVAASLKSDVVAAAVEAAVTTASAAPVADLAVKTEVFPLLDTPKATAPGAPAVTKGPTATEVAEMIKRARGRLDLGDIAGARLLLERAASGNDPNALMALAETYDPAMLTRLGVRGPKGDLAKARELYERAAASGAPEAGQRVLALR
jgi:TPR repeat protein